MVVNTFSYALFWKKCGKIWAEKGGKIWWDWRNTARMAMAGLGTGHP